MAISTINDLLNLSWNEMVEQIPDPPQIKKEVKTPRTAALPKSTRRKTVRQSVKKDSGVSYAQQKMNIFCTQPELEEGPRKLVASMLLSLSPEKALENLQKIYKTYYSGNFSSSSNARKGSFSKFMKKKSGSSISSKAPVIEVKNFKLDFGLEDGTLSPLHENMTCDVTVSLKAGKGRYYWYLPNPDPAYSLSVSPLTGTFKKKGEQKFTVVINFKSSIFVEEIISLEVPGVGRFFFLILLESVYSVFGEDIRQYNVKGKGVEIPPSLKAMKDYLISSNAFEKSDIFINNGIEEEILTIRDKLNRENFTDCRDIHSLAKTLIAWFDEQSPKLLQGVSENLLLSASGQQEYLSVLDMMKEPQRTIVVWLLDILVDVTLKKDKNNVKLSQLADIISPSLYTPQSADSTKNLQLPSAVSKMIIALVEYRIKLR